jgi:hypothetical protein
VALDRLRGQLARVADLGARRRPQRCGVRIEPEDDAASTLLY